MRVFRARDHESAVRRGLLTRWGRGVYLVGPLTDDLTEARAAAARGAARRRWGSTWQRQLAQFGPIAAPPLDVIVRAGPPREPDGRADPPDRARAGRTSRGWRASAAPPPPSPSSTWPARSPALPYERAVQEAFAKRLTDTKQPRAGPRPPPRRPRHGPPRRMLELGVDDLRSKAERSLRHWVRAASLPSPLFNAQLGPWQVDALWPTARASPSRSTATPPTAHPGRTTATTARSSTCSPQGLDHPALHRAAGDRRAGARDRADRRRARRLRSGSASGTPRPGRPSRCPRSSGSSCRSGTRPSRPAGA